MRVKGCETYKNLREIKKLQQARPEIFYQNSLHIKTNL